MTCCARSFGPFDSGRKRRSEMSCYSDRKSLVDFLSVVAPQKLLVVRCEFLAYCRPAWLDIKLALKPRLKLLDRCLLLGWQFAARYQRGHLKMKCLPGIRRPPAPGRHSWLGHALIQDEGVTYSFDPNHFRPLPWKYRKEI